jgi:hypothetical protein
MPGFNGGTVTHRKGYLRIKAGPLRDCLVHRLVAAALIGRDLDKSEEAHHLDADRKNPHWSNLIVLGSKDHGWVSARQAWYMREKDKREKAEWYAWMNEVAAEFTTEVQNARADGVPWQMTRVDGEMQVEWEARRAANS